MKNAIKRGLIGLGIACGVTLLVAIPYPPPWTLGEVLVPLGIASFFAAAASVCREKARPRSLKQEN